MLRICQASEDYFSQIIALLDAVEPHTEQIQNSGVARLIMWLVVYCDMDEQKNLELPPDEMRRLSAIGATLAISHYVA